MRRRSRLHPQRLLIYLLVVVCGAGLAWSWSASRQPHVASKTTAVEAPVEHTPKPPPVTMSLAPSEPVRLRVAKIRLDAPVEPVGLTKTGEMDAPRSAAGVGWYRSGYLPGSLGNAVLAAHYMHTTGPGAFYRLSQLKAGDLLELKTKEATQYYQVTSSKSYPAESTSSELDEVFGKSKQANLNLVTCSGEWDAASNRYRDRLVVFSRFVREAKE